VVEEVSDPPFFEAPTVVPSDDWPLRSLPEALVVAVVVVVVVVVEPVVALVPVVMIVAFVVAGVVLVLVLEALVSFPLPELYPLAVVEGCPPEEPPFPGGASTFR